MEQLPPGYFSIIIIFLWKTFTVLKLQLGKKKIQVFVLGILLEVFVTNEKVEKYNQYSKNRPKR